MIQSLAIELSTSFTFPQKGGFVSIGIELDPTENLFIKVSDTDNNLINEGQAILYQEGEVFAQTAFENGIASFSIDANIDYKLILKSSKHQTTQLNINEPHGVHFLPVTMQKIVPFSIVVADETIIAKNLKPQDSQNKLFLTL